ncbi:uncharacterized protein LOC126765957 [Bactrocera neohumeralis]|uniref:uncharacterized protein LOC126765957 n=1 Tax=Bactrocera neohumeralis TaxID=98809 RepID=UPI0021658FBB|nr:uncharacterized protein LOC126765957 [Bactrocera neohumeralis]
MYKYIFAVIDAFTKFSWLYPTKSTSAKEVISKLMTQSINFGNPVKIISDRGSAFTSDEFKEYCRSENIKHVKITTGLPRANGQIERLNSSIIAVLSKLSIEDATKWYRYVDRVQQFNQNRDEMRNDGKKQILKIQEENKKSYNLRRKKAHIYKLNDIVAIKRTQLGSGLKLKQKFLGPYRITNVKPNNTYDVQKLGNGEGPKTTTTCAEFMKEWLNTFDDDDST